MCILTSPRHILYAASPGRRAHDNLPRTNSTAETSAPADSPNPQDKYLSSRTLRTSQQSWRPNSDRGSSLQRLWERNRKSRARLGTQEERSNIRGPHKFCDYWQPSYTSSCLAARKSETRCSTQADLSSIVATQFLGVPLYWINRDLYYAWMAITKQSFGIFVTTLTQWWAPTLVRVSGDASVAGELHRTPDGRLECSFPDRLVMIANHQVWSRSWAWNCAD